MTYSIVQDTRYQDRSNIIATNFAGQSTTIAKIEGNYLVSSRQLAERKVKQLEMPYGC